MTNAQRREARRCALEEMARDFESSADEAEMNGTDKDCPDDERPAHLADADGYRAAAKAVRLLLEAMS